MSWQHPDSKLSIVCSWPCLSRCATAGGLGTAADCAGGGQISGQLYCKQGLPGGPQERMAGGVPQPDVCSALLGVCSILRFVAPGAQRCPEVCSLLLRTQQQHRVLLQGARKPWAAFFGAAKTGGRPRTHAWLSHTQRGLRKVLKEQHGLHPSLPCCPALEAADRAWLASTSDAVRLCATWHVHRLACSPLDAAYQV